MSTGPEFKFGDQVVHAQRPEWGVGTVTGASRTTLNGEPCQRLALRFERAGLKNLTVPPADIVPADDVERPAQRAAAQPADWLDEVDQRDLPKAMAELPESCRDPFASHESRLRATLDQYRFSKEGGSLLDWAAAQTGLSDPMTRFNRHELEQFFDRYAYNRDQHLKKLVAESRRTDPGLAGRLAQDAPRAARSALSRVDAAR